MTATPDTKLTPRPPAGITIRQAASAADFRPDLDPTGELAGRVLDVLARTLP